MDAEILAVGTELLMGQISNTNAQYLSGRLNDLGIRVLWHSVVGDNAQRLADSLRHALSRADIVVTTGGLGPTADDLTKETAAAVFGLKLVRDEEILEQIRSFFYKVGREMVGSNEKQAWLPEGSMLIPNKYGTAPGCIIEKNGKILVMLPGPPKEMIPMFEDTVFPYLESRTGKVMASRILRVFGLGESLMESRILDLINAQTNPTIAPYVGDGDVVIRVTALAKTKEAARELLEPVVSAISERLGDHLYSTNGVSMEEIVGRLLIERNLKISTAESCTGGLLASRLVNVPGISSVFEKGFIVYANQAKEDLIGVSKETLEKYGAVSEETAVEMAEKLHSKTACDVAVAVTGIAGPGGGSAQKPVGLVYIAVKAPGGMHSCMVQLNGNRERIRTMTVLYALDTVRRMLLGLTWR